MNRHKANGNDTYIFGRGYGHDTIIDGDTTPNIDRLQFKDDISPADLTVTREGLDLALTVKDSDDVVTLQKYFAESSHKEVAIHPYEIEEIEFADATVWSSATIRDLLLAGSDNAETIIGYKDDDVITGQDGDDTIEGRSGNDILHGGGGNDTIRAGLGSDLIEGGTGNDLLDGNGNESGFSDGWLHESVADDDIYVFGEGDGHDTIVDLDWRSTNMDTLRFKEDVAVDELFFERIDNSTGDLKIVLGDGLEDSITVRNWFGYNADFFKIERLEFVDGTVLDADYVETHLSKIGTTENDTLNGSLSSESLFGFAGNDTLYGRDGDDIFDGGRGDDLLSGGKGSDSYLFNRGSGSDTIVEDNTDDGAVDVIILGPDILPADLVVSRSATDLILTINDTEDRLIIKEGLDGNAQAKSIEEVRFADGQVWDYNELQARAISQSLGDAASDGDDIIFGTPFGDALLGDDGNDLLFGLEGDDYLHGGPDRDWLEGGDGSDTLFGGVGDDVIFGGAGADQITAGPGNDLAYGGLGGDVYIFHAGDGHLVIEDYFEEAASDGSDYGGYDYGGDYGGTISPVNVLQFGPGIVLADLVFSEQEGYLIIDIPATGDQIRLAGYAPDRPTFTNAVDIFRFSDGSEPSRENLLDQGAAVTGTSGDDIFPGAPGNDRLAGGSGNDTYTFAPGDGVDTIVDMSGDGLENSIQFGAGISVDDIQAVVDNGTLVLRVGADGDAIRFEGFDPGIAGMPFPVGHIGFSDGTSLSFAALLSRGYEIVGTPGEDTLFGTSSHDRIRGLGGDDIIRGDAGDDTYLLAPGDGVDTIDDIAQPGQDNTLVLPEGSDPDHIRLSHDPQSQLLILRESATDSEVRLTGFDRLDPFGQRAVQWYQFGTAGTTLSYEELLARGFDIDGTAGSETLLGTSLTDRMHAGSGDDLLSGGTGNDFLFGEAGNDTYIFNRGDGIVHIKDFSEPGATNILRFGPGIEPEDLRRHLYFAAPESVGGEEGEGQGTLIIVFDNGDAVHLAGFNPEDVRNSPRSVDTFQFADGASLSFDELVDFTFIVEGDGTENELFGTNLGDRLYGRDGSDTLFSGAGDDVLTGGTGSDRLAGGTGRDVYAAGLGDGTDTIIDAAENGIGNSILFGEGISREDILLAQEGSNLTIKYGNLGDRLQVLNFDPAGVDGSLVIDTFEFADGSSVSYHEFVNHAPVAGEAELPDLTVTENEMLTFRLPENSFFDPDGSPLMYTAEISNFTSMPEWLHFDRAATIFSGTPTSNDVGSFQVTVSAFDPLAAGVSRSFNIVVQDGNDAPVKSAEGGGNIADLQFQGDTYIEGNLTLAEETMDTLHLKDIGKADLEFRKSGSALMIDVRQKGSIRVNGYFLAPEKGLKSLATIDGPIHLEKDYVVKGQSWGSVLNGAVHGLLGDKLLVPGTTGPDMLLGGADNDVLYGSGDDDSVMGLLGDDLLIGRSGNDHLFGNDGSDTVYGDQGDDDLSGGSGNDFLIGGAGSDRLNGGQGSDTLVGGSGSDTFIFDTGLNRQKNTDTIVDFVVDQDKIELDQTIFSSLPEEGSLFSEYFLASATGAAGDGNDYLLYSTTSGALLYDADGNGQGVAVEFASLASKPELTAKDFVIAS